VSPLRLLLPGPAVVGDLERGRADTLQALADLYAYPDPVTADGYVRANMVATLDGSARDADGSSRGISAPADQAVLGVLRALADVVVVGAGTARAAARTRAVAALAARGLRRVLVEGGPSLLGRVAAAGCLDELCLTWSPLLVGGDGPRIAHGAPFAAALRPAPLVESDGLLLGRWVVVPGRA
jgi:riboflavin biosynthesis pyrimidine reductase